MKLLDLIGKGLEGGTLVEYKANTGFGLEYGRAMIQSVGVNQKMFHIRTDNEESFLEQNVSPEVERMGFTAEVEKRGPYFLISSSMGWCYVAVPKGIEIPNRPNWLDVSVDEFVGAIKRHYGAK